MRYKRHSMTLRLCASFVLAFVSSPHIAGAQNQTNPHTYEQLAFGIEGVPTLKPMDLPHRALRVLRKTDFVHSCLREGTLKAAPSSWFVAFEVHLAGIVEADLVVQPRNQLVSPASNDCLFHARSMPFWILRPSRAGYALILEEHTQELEVLKTRSNGLLDVETSVGPTKSLFKYGGSEYKLVQRNTER